MLLLSEYFIIVFLIPFIYSRYFDPVNSNINLLKTCAFFHLSIGFSKAHYHDIGRGIYGNNFSNWCEEGETVTLKVPVSAFYRDKNFNPELQNPQQLLSFS
jgi:hypothetical protein